jgi:hypothetical protein
LRSVADAFGEVVLKRLSLMSAGEIIFGKPPASASHAGRSMSFRRVGVLLMVLGCACVVAALHGKGRSARGIDGLGGGLWHGGRRSDRWLARISAHALANTNA